MPELSTLIEAARAGGAPLAIVFCVLWWLERRDNRQLMLDVAHRLEKLSTALLLIKERIR